MSCLYESESRKGLEGLGEAGSVLGELLGAAVSTASDNVINIGVPLLRDPEAVVESPGSHFSSLPETFTSANFDRNKEDTYY